MTLKRYDLFRILNFAQTVWFIVKIVEINKKKNTNQNVVTIIYLKFKLKIECWCYGIQFLVLYVNF